MRIATWNINGLRARLDFVLRWLSERQPDVVGLQELKLTDDLFPHEAFEAAGYHALTHGQKSWNGVAILSKEEATLRQRGLTGQEEFGARLIEARIGGIDFATVYCPNGKNLEHDDYPRKLAWFDRLAEDLSERADAGEERVLCGDFNIVPTALDSFSEEKLAGDIFHTDAERVRLQRVMDWGFVDLYRSAHPDAAEFSWWDYRGGSFHRNHGLRIDFLLGTRPLLERVTHVEIDREWRKKKDGLTASDHAPVWADLR